MNHSTSIDTEPNGLETGGPRYRWRCTCGATGDWKLKPGSAAIGGKKHVAQSSRHGTP
jgi:hypothetical protein